MVVTSVPWLLTLQKERNITPDLILSELRYVLGLNVLYMFLSKESIEIMHFVSVQLILRYKVYLSQGVLSLDNVYWSSEGSFPKVDK